MDKLTSSPFLMIAINVLLCSFGQLFLKKGMNAQVHAKAASGASAIMGALKGFTSPMVLFGLVLYGCSLVLWLMILKKADLSKAFPMMSMTYVLVVVLSSVVLKEKIAVTTVCGLALICCGVALIGIGMASTGGE